jgi:translation initiation factor eIF-2B subunit alpha
VTDDSTILVHGYSRAVMALLVKAAASNIRFNVLVTEARPGNLGQRAIDECKDKNIPCRLILDAGLELANMCSCRVFYRQS